METYQYKDTPLQKGSRDMEIWKSVPGWEGLYEASSEGRIRSLPHKQRRGGGCGYEYIQPGKILAPHLNQVTGYKAVGLWSNKRTITRAVHVLVASAFYGERPVGEKIQACHYDGNRQNNIATNLGWVPAQENASHRSQHGTQKVGSDHANAKLNNESVRVIRSAVLSRKEYARIYGVSETAIAHVQRRKTWRHVN